MSPEDLAAEERARAEFAAAVQSTAAGAPSPLAATERYFQAACAAGAVSPLTLDAADWAEAPEDPRVRQLTVYERLRRLGYPVPASLPPSATGDALWAVLRPVFAQFQREALGDGLLPGVVAGELGVRDWDALREIFDFESPLVLAHWFTAGVPRPALVRALRLRLSVLGFGALPTPDDFRPAPRELSRFAAAAVALGVTDEPLPAEVTPAWAAVLFDHDRLMNALAASGPRLARARGTEAERLLLCAAKVELWLQGYNVKPDGDPTLATPGLHGSHRSGGAAQPTEFVREFGAFLRDHDAGSWRLSPARLPSLAPELLSLARDERAPVARTSADETIRQLGELLHGEPKLWDRIREVGRGLVSTLFDGARRVLTWIGKLVREGWGKLKALALQSAAVTANLWRTLYHCMNGTAFHLRRALRAFADGVEFLARPVQAAEPPGSALSCRRPDGDVAQVIAADAEAEAVRALARRLERGSRCFTIACRIVRLVFTAIRTALEGVAANLAGFAPLMLGLASMYEQIRQLGALLVELGA